MNLLILCTGNSCRSQMAHGYFEHFAGDQLKVYSAGIETHGVNPGAIQIMQEDGIDISDHTSNHIEEYQDIRFDYMITVCDHAKENCPVFHNYTHLFHRAFADPSKVKGDPSTVHAAFVETRDAIKSWTNAFVHAYIR